MAVTGKEFQEFVKQRFRDGLCAPELFNHRLMEVLDFAVANEASMDAEARACYDQLLEAVATMYEVGLAGVADSPSKRKMLRLIALTRRKHHHAAGFLEGLGKPLPTPFPIAEAGKVIFLEVLQSVLDFLFDSTRQKQKGPAQFASLSMLYWAVDELTVAFYLSERKYTTQAYSHLRTVHDLLDKAELFFQQPQWADVWTGEDKQKILKQLSPGAVRKKLGRPKFDPVYDFLTERGMHGTWGAVQRRVAGRGKSKGTTHVAVWIGGVPWDEEVDIAVCWCILSSVSTLVTVAKVYATRLHAEETLAMIEARRDSAVEFLRLHVLKPMQDAGADVSAFAEALHRITSWTSSAKAM